MTNLVPLSDADARDRAETTFDQNVVVLAGAGTGKTTLLVNRLLHALLREPHPLRLTQMLALTFTNKAANEMKGRLREALRQLLTACQSTFPHEESSDIKLKEFQERYQLSTEHIEETVTHALHDLETAHITTLHSFAAHILRLYPLESGVDPHFQEDDGGKFVEIFSDVWNCWLDKEFGGNGSHHAEWLEILDVVDLKGIRDFAFALCKEQVDLGDLHTQLNSERPSPALVSWIQRNLQRITSLLQENALAKPRKIERLLEVAKRIFDLIAREGWKGVRSLENEEKVLLASAIGHAPKGWVPDDFQEARHIVQSARHLLRVDEEFLSNLIGLLTPFVEQVCHSYADKGWIQFDGLLVRVRNVLRDYPQVREQLKVDFQAIMVDEFQDTDPLQYEILLYLGEQIGEHCQEWDAIRLTPGKFFIVGDPKQSIYAFRRADIQAFDHVIRKLTHDDGVICRLTTNFRSASEVLGVINAVFDRVLVQKDHVQPPNVPLSVGRQGEVPLPASGAQLYVMVNKREEEWDAERATRLEAEWLASWIEEEVLKGQQWVLEQGTRVPLRHGHVAVLFRKFTNAHVYLEAMHRRGVPYRTDGERHFYRRQEVIDLVNVLRVLDNPTDAIALVGILRSSLGGVPDQEIMELTLLGPLDIRRIERLDKWESTRKPVIQALFEQFKTLSEQAKRIPLPEFIDRVLGQLPIVELAAASLHGEQAVMNVWKLRDLMVAQAALPHLSYSGWVHRLIDYLNLPPPESEALLEEESLDAIHVLSIHKAKGLEFPVVVLPGLHQKTPGLDRGIQVTVDWMSGVYGCTFPSAWNVGQVFLWEKEQIREKAEQRRIMYVGMTRARDRLILSGGQLTKPIGESFLGILQGVAEREIGNLDHKTVQIGNAEIPQTIVTLGDLPALERTKQSFKRHMIQNRDERSYFLEKDCEREKARQQALCNKAFLNPSLLHLSQAQGRSWPRPKSSSVGNQRIGSLVHQLLEQWDFELNEKNYRELLCEYFKKELSKTLEEEEKNPIVEDIEDMMKTFLQSPFYQDLQRGKILGREIPFMMPWSEEEQIGVEVQLRVMEGVMDVVYELDGDIWVGDYKTDWVTDSSIVGYAERYHQQAQAYVMATSRSLGVEVKGCQLFFLRMGQTVTILNDVIK